MNEKNKSELIIVGAKASGKTTFAREARNSFEQIAAGDDKGVIILGEARYERWLKTVEN